MKTFIIASLLLLVGCGGSAASVSDESRPSEPAHDQSTSTSEVSSPDAARPASDVPSTPLPDAGDAGAEAGIDAAINPPPHYGVSVAGNLQRVEASYPPGVTGSANLTLEGWFKVRQVTANGMFFHMRGASCSIAGSGYGPNQGKVNCLARLNTTDAASQIFSKVAIPLNVWHHIAFVKQGAMFTLYVDGVTQGHATPDFDGMPGPTATSKVRFGGSTGDASESLDGVVDEARLSLQADYTVDFIPPAHVGSSGSLSLLLDEGMGTIVGANTATLENGATWTTVTR